MPRLITDFDGPIMDVSERYYQVYLECLAQVRRPRQALMTLSKAEFWALKRARVPEKEIGLRSGLNASQSQTFAQLRADLVHTMPYFEYDTIIPGAVEALERLQAAGVDLVVMTMRRVRELNYALNRYDLGRFFAPERRYCLGNDYVKTGDTKDKPLLMARAMTELPPASPTWMVGDTEADMASAQSQNLPAVAVLSGIRDRDQLIQCDPTHVVRNFASAVELFLEQEQLIERLWSPAIKS